MFTGKIISKVKIRYIFPPFRSENKKTTVKRAFCIKNDETGRLVCRLPPLSAVPPRGVPARCENRRQCFSRKTEKEKGGSAFPARTNSPRIKFGGCLLNAEIFTILLMNFGKGFKPEFMEKLNLYGGFSAQ